MADPKQKSLELPAYLTRVLPFWGSPGWMEAERWRRVVYNLPLAIDCRDVLINDLVAADWEVRAREPKEEDALADDIEHYTDVVEVDIGNGVGGFDAWVEVGGQDLLTLPAGWNNEIVRYPDGQGPLSRPYAENDTRKEGRGHVAWIAYMDGATAYPTYDRDFPLAQRLKEDLSHIIYFERSEMARVVMTPRPEMQRWGYGMPPPEKIYLAITLLFRGDQYYANLLLDTPEAGLLDLMDFSQKAANEWLRSTKELMQGLDPFKIPVLYEHEKPANWIPFGRPPTELMFRDSYIQYGQITAAGYGLTLTDIGLGDPQRTLAGSIRDERKSRRSGFAVVREKVRQMIDADILPDYLEFIWQEKDEEAKVQRGRSFMLAAQALKASREAGFISKLEGQQQLVKDGHLTVEVEEPEELPMPALPAFGGFGGARQETERVPASEGGRGDLGANGSQQQRAEVGERIAAVPADTAKFDQLAQVLRDAFAAMRTEADRPRLLKLIKAATRALFPDTIQAFINLEDSELPFWLEERASLWAGMPSEFDALPDVRKQADAVLDDLDGLLDGDRWWALPVAAGLTDAIALIFKLAYEEGASEAAQIAWELLYTEGLVDTPHLIGLNFSLTNPRTLAELTNKAAELVTRVNDGTKYYLKRIITRGVEEGLSSPSIAKLIREGADAETVLKDAGYQNAVIKQAQFEISNMTEQRTNSIVNTEIARAETDGRVGQWGQMGLTKKAWMHTGATGANDPCPYCQANIDMGFVPIDHMYESVFGEGTVLGPPAHPQVDHCHIIFDEGELIGKAGELEVWAGG